MGHQPQSASFVSLCAIGRTYRASKSGLCQLKIPTCSQLPQMFVLSEPNYFGLLFEMLLLHLDFDVIGYFG